MSKLPPEAHGVAHQHASKINGRVLDFGPWGFELPLLCPLPRWSDLPPLPTHTVLADYLLAATCAPAPPITVLIHTHQHTQSNVKFVHDILDVVLKLQNK